MLCSLKSYSAFLFSFSEALSLLLACSALLVCLTTLLRTDNRPRRHWSLGALCFSSGGELALLTAECQILFRGILGEEFGSLSALGPALSEQDVNTGSAEPTKLGLLSFASYTALSHLHEHQTDPRP